MKYENFEKTKNLYDEIVRLTGKLKELDGDLDVIIAYPSSGRIFEIEVFATSIDIYAPLARKLIADIKNDLTSRISDLKQMLSEL